jgi:hypothetical protein
LVKHFSRYEFPKFSTYLKLINRNGLKEKGFASRSVAKGSKFITDRSSGYYSHESLTTQKTPGVLLNRTRGPSPNEIVTAVEERAEGLTGGEIAPVKWSMV